MRTFSLLPPACRGQNRNEAEVFACDLKGGVFVVSDQKRGRGASRVTAFSNGWVVKTAWDPGSQSYATGILRSSRSRPHSEIEAQKASRARAHHDNAIRRVIR